MDYKYHEHKDNTAFDNSVHYFLNWYYKSFHAKS